MTIIDHALELDDAPDLDDDEQRERWKIRSDRAASWALRRLGAAQAEIARIRQAAQDEIDSLKAWTEAATAGPARDVAFFEAVLVNYRLELEEANPNLPKTYKVPGGTIARRKSADKIEVVDAPALIAWALSEGRVDLLKIEPRVSALKEFEAHHDKAIDEETGEVTTDPDGILTTGEGDDIAPVPGVVHLVRPDTYNANPDA